MLSATFESALAGDRRLLARAISAIENRSAGVLEAVATLHPRRATGPGAPQVIGLTGPPGAGKSTLTDGLIRLARAQGRRVAVLAVDPSSPFSGGAILGDRLRMEDHAGDPGVFIRSLASRGHLGGLCRSAGQVVELFDAAGFDLVLVETVGVGQSELSIMEVADTVIVVLTPESGDVVQTMKAGLLEVADIFVVNKADRPGADRLSRDLELMVHLSLDEGEGIWAPPVLTASAVQSRGLDEVASAAESHRVWCVSAGRGTWAARRGAGRVRTFLDLVGEDARERAVAALNGPSSALAADLRSGALNPYLAAARWAPGGSP